MKTSLLLMMSALLLTAQAGAQTSGDWQLRVRKEADGWSASFSGTSDYGSSRHRVRGSGVRVEKQRALPAFSQLRIDGPLDVRLQQAAADQATVIADDNIEPLIETVVEGDTLVLRLKRDAGFSTRHAPSIRVDARKLRSVSVQGSGDLAVERFKADALSLAISGSGDVRLGLLELRELNVSISGSGDVQAAGRADLQSWRIDGSGDVDARSLSGRQVKVVLNGSGDADLGVSEQLDAQLSGSGDLSYAGRPQLRQSVSGSGEIRRR